MRAASQCPCVTTARDRVHSGVENDCAKALTEGKAIIIGTPQLWGLTTRAAAQLTARHACTLVAHFTRTCRAEGTHLDPTLFEDLYSRCVPEQQSACGVEPVLREGGARELAESGAGAQTAAPQTGG